MTRDAAGRPKRIGQTRLSRSPFLRVAALSAALLVVAACAGDKPIAGMVREPTPDVSQVVLPDVAFGGKDFATRADPGHLLLVYFGYTNCPDICPTTLADVRRSVAALGDDGEKIDLAMITVDPERDTADRLTGYAQTFFDAAHALRTEDPAQLAIAAEAYGASYEVSKSSDDVTEVAHSAFLYVVDANGHILVQWPFGTSSEDMENDLAILIKETAPT